MEFHTLESCKETFLDTLVPVISISKSKVKSQSKASVYYGFFSVCFHALWRKQFGLL